ncbi:MAG: hypothetical protein ACO3UU_10755, partial [Minisyncoccia bacterium]
MNFGPQIVRSGLVLYLDAANRKSYRGTGTAWQDLSGNRANFTLGFAGAGGAIPTFSNNAIKTSFIATTQNHAYCNNNNTTLRNLLYNNHTIEIACKINSLTRGIDLNAAYTTETRTGMLIWPGYHSGLMLDNANLLYVIWNGTTGEVTTFTNITSYVSKNIVINAVRISNTMYIYINGALITSANITAPTNYGYVDLIAGCAKTTNVVSNNTYTFPSNIDYYNVKLYNIGFTQSQVTQNFNATKTR